MGKKHVCANVRVLNARHTFSFFLFGNKKVTMCLVTKDHYESCYDF